MDNNQANELITKDFKAYIAKDNIELTKLSESMDKFMALSQKAFNEQNWDAHKEYGDKFEKAFDRAISILNEEINVLPGKLTRTFMSYQKQ